MFKYVSYTKVVDEITTHEFRGGDDLVKVNYFSGVDVVSIEADVEADIDALIASQESVINCTVITVDEFKLLVANSSTIKRIYERASKQLENDLSAIKEKYPLEERETWAVQKEEALKFQASNNESDAPFLKTLADAEGTTVADFATAVLAKNSLFAQDSALALSNKRKTQSELLAGVGYL